MKADTHPSAPLGSLGILSHLGIPAADPGKHQDSLAWAFSFWGRQVSAEGWPCTHRPSAVSGGARRESTDVQHSTPVKSVPPLSQASRCT